MGDFGRPDLCQVYLVSRFTSGEKKDCVVSTG